MTLAGAVSIDISNTATALLSNRCARPSMKCDSRRISSRASTLTVRRLLKSSSVGAHHKYILLLVDANAH